MSDPAESVTLFTQYTSKVDEDLTAREKERADLVARLAVVERDLELLKKVKAAISSDEEGSPSHSGEVTAVVASESGDESTAPVGEQGALQAPAQESTARKTPAKKAAAKKTAAKKTAAKKATAKQAEPTEAGTSRRQLILGYIEEVGQPRSSAEVAKELTHRHAEFTSSPAATREALEALVARGKLERTTQGRSVYYGPVTPTREGSEDAAEESAQLVS